ncbi:MAG: TrmH family RNA methyltransferase [Streptococcus salivarius]
MEIIQSKQNASIKSARKLLQRKHRKTSYLLEGWHLFEEAKASGADILQVFVLEEMADRVANMAKVKLVSPEVLKELCETQTPQGIVAEVAKQSQALPEPLSGKYLLLEDVQDPGNVGTMIRTADAAGYDGVFLSDKSADIYNQKTLRSMQEVISIFQSIVDLFLTWLRLAKSKGYPSWQRHFPMFLLTIKQLRQMAILL